MTDREKDKALLVKQAAQLYLLGLKIDREQQLIRRGKKAGRSNPDLVEAHTRLVKDTKRWAELEAGHLRLRKRLGLW